jgi:hypothetical protein
LWWSCQRFIVKSRDYSINLSTIFQLIRWADPTFYRHSTTHLHLKHIPLTIHN